MFSYLRKVVNRVGASATNIVESVVGKSTAKIRKEDKARLKAARIQEIDEGIHNVLTEFNPTLHTASEIINEIRYNYNPGDPNVYMTNDQKAAYRNQLDDSIAQLNRHMAARVRLQNNVTENYHKLRKHLTKDNGYQYMRNADKDLRKQITRLRELIDGLPTEPPPPENSLSEAIIHHVNDYNSPQMAAYAEGMLHEVLANGGYVPGISGPGFYPGNRVYWEISPDEHRYVVDKNRLITLLSNPDFINRVQAMNMNGFILIMKVVVQSNYVPLIYYHTLTANKLRESVAHRFHFLDLNTDAYYLSSATFENPDTANEVSASFGFSYSADGNMHGLQYTQCVINMEKVQESLKKVSEQAKDYVMKYLYGLFDYFQVPYKIADGAIRYHEEICFLHSMVVQAPDHFTENITNNIRNKLLHECTGGLVKKIHIVDILKTYCPNFEIKLTCLERDVIKTRAYKGSRNTTKTIKIGLIHKHYFPMDTSYLEKTYNIDNPTQRAARWLKLADKFSNIYITPMSLLRYLEASEFAEPYPTEKKDNHLSSLPVMNPNKRLLWNEIDNLDLSIAVKGHLDGHEEPNINNRTIEIFNREFFPKQTVSNYYESDDLLEKEITTRALATKESWENKELSIPIIDAVYMKKSSSKEKVAKEPFSTDMKVKLTQKKYLTSIGQTYEPLSYFERVCFIDIESYSDYSADIDMADPQSTEERHVGQVVDYSTSYKFEDLPTKTILTTKDKSSMISALDHLCVLAENKFASNIRKSFPGQTIRSKDIRHIFNTYSVRDCHLQVGAHNAKFDMSVLLSSPRLHKIEKFIGSGPSDIKTCTLIYTVPHYSKYDMNKPPTDRHFKIKFFNTMAKIPVKLADFPALFDIKIQKAPFPYGYFTRARCEALIESSWMKFTRVPYTAIIVYIPTSEKAEFNQALVTAQCCYGNALQKRPISDVVLITPQRDPLIDIVKYLCYYNELDVDVMSEGYKQFHVLLLENLGVDALRKPTTSSTANMVCETYHAYDDVPDLVGTLSESIRSNIQGGFSFIHKDRPCSSTAFKMPEYSFTEPKCVTSDSVKTLKGYLDKTKFMQEPLQFTEDPAPRQKISNFNKVINDIRDFLNIPKLGPIECIESVRIRMKDLDLTSCYPASQFSVPSGHPFYVKREDYDFCKTTFDYALCHFRICPGGNSKYPSFVPNVHELTDCREYIRKRPNHGGFVSQVGYYKSINEILTASDYIEVGSEEDLVPGTFCIVEMLVFTSISTTLWSITQYLYRWRLKVKRTNKGLANLLKLILNSCWGFLAHRSYPTSVKIFSSINEVFQQLRSKDILSCEALSNGKFFVTLRNQVATVYKSKAQVAMSVLNNAKTMIFRHMKSVIDSGSDVVYSDTDSVHVLWSDDEAESRYIAEYVIQYGKHPFGEDMTGSELGSMKIDYESSARLPKGATLVSEHCYKFHYIARKVYCCFIEAAYRMENDPQIKYLRYCHARVKGVRQSSLEDAVKRLTLSRGVDELEGYDIIFKTLYVQSLLKYRIERDIIRHLRKSYFPAEGTFCPNILCGAVCYKDYCEKCYINMPDETLKAMKKDFDRYYKYNVTLNPHLFTEFDMLTSGIAVKFLPQGAFTSTRFVRRI
jgi:hypothetical protein